MFLSTRFEMESNAMEVSLANRSDLFLLLALLDRLLPAESDVK